MKRMNLMKWKVWTIVGALALGIAMTCSGAETNAEEQTDSTEQGDSTDQWNRQDWVSPEVVEYTLRKNPYYENTLYDFSCSFTNESETGIMEIQYTVTFTDADGEVLSEISRVYNGEDTPLAPGETVTVDTGGRFEVVVTDQDIADVAIEVSKVCSEEEMPPIHLPQEGEYLYKALGNANLENILKKPPVRIETWTDYMGARVVAVVSDPEAIEEIMPAFAKIMIARETDEWVTDHYNGIMMTFENEETGEEEYMIIRLNMANLEYQVYGHEHIYELDDFETFWELILYYGTFYEEGEPHDDA